MRSPRSPVAAAAHVAVAALATLAPHLPAQSNDERALVELRKAMDLAAEGNYRAAHAAYRRIGKKWPSTAAGQIAASRGGKTAFLGWTYLVETGPSANRVDVAILGDGFTLAEQNRFDDLAKTVAKTFEKQKLLGEYLSYFNFLRVNVASKDGDIDAYGREYDTALGGAIRGKNAPWVSVSNALVMEALDQLPEHDRLALVFTKSLGFHGTAGGGVGVVSGRKDGTVVHEWGHAFAALGDEYTTFTFPRGSVRECVNISRTEDPKRVPWAHWIEAKAPGIGVYRGGAGRLKGAWRPTSTGCIMQRGQRFCYPCREALVLRIYRYVDGIDGCSPPSHATNGRSTPLRPDRKKGFTFEVEIMQPESHGLDVEWYVLSANEVPRPVVEDDLTDRRKRGKLNPIAVKPKKRIANARQRRQSFRWTPDRDERGRFRVVCRVRDHAKPAGQQLPWVLKDDRGLLESERGWWVQVR